MKFRVTTRVLLTTLSASVISAVASGQAGGYNPYAQTPIAPSRAAPQATSSAADQVRGDWVELEFHDTSSGDGITGPQIWNTPRLFRVTPGGEGTNAIIVEVEDRPGERPLLLRQETPTRWVFMTSDDPGAYMEFTIDPDNGGYAAKIHAPRLGLEGDFEAARTRDGRLARDVNPLRGTDDGSDVKNPYNWNFFGYDGLKMAIDAPLNGQTSTIFALPNDFPVDRSLRSKAPLGVRALPQVPTSGFNETEAVITNEAEFSKSMSFTFGGKYTPGIKNPKDGKSGFGATYTKENLIGQSTTEGTHTAVGIARIERYVYLLDKPNIRLAPNFRLYLDGLIAGSRTPEEVIVKFGSHYANAVTYGGLGWANKRVTNSEIANRAASSNGGDATGGVAGAFVNVAFNESTDSTQGNSSVFSKTDFHMVGGSGVTSALFANVQDYDAVPIRYDLRPLSDLISPLFFPAGFDSVKLAALASARQRLAAAIEQHMASAPELSSETAGPQYYRITFNHLRCLNPGDNGLGISQLKGQLLANYEDDSGRTPITLLDFNVRDLVIACKPPGQLAQPFSTVPQTLPLAPPVTVAITPVPMPQHSPLFGRIRFFTRNLVDKDDGVVRLREGVPNINYDDPIYTVTDSINATDPSGFVPLDYKDALSIAGQADGRPRQVMLGGRGDYRSDAPMLAITYTIERVRR